MISLRSITSSYNIHTVKPKINAKTPFFQVIVPNYQSQKSFTVTQFKNDGISRMKPVKIGLSILLAGIFITFHVLKKSQTDQSEQIQSFVKTLDKKILETIVHAEEIPDLKAAELASREVDLSRMWRQLIEKGALEISGIDQEVRPNFVALQAIMEHILSNELMRTVTSLQGIILTSMPATSLCRPIILREFLNKAGNLYVVYPIGGMAKCTSEQRDIYIEELHKYQDHLFDKVLACTSVPDELMGAVYVFKNQGNWFAFAIKMTQAKDPQAEGDFGLWFGPLDHPEVKQRVTTVLDFIKENQVEVCIKVSH